MLFGIVHDIAMPDALKHGDVVVRIAHGGGIGDIDAELLAQVRDARTLVDAQVHKVDPLAAGIGDVELVRERGVIVLAKCGLGIVGGEEDRDLVGVDVEALKGIDVVDRVVVNAELVVVLVVASKHVKLVEAAQDGDSARILRGAAQDLLIQRHIDSALIDIVAAVDHAGSVIGAESKAVFDVLEHLLELGGGTSAGGAEHDAGVGELVQALIEALGQYALVGQQCLVHIDGKDLDVADSGVRFVSLHKSAFPFLNCFGRNNPPVGNRAYFRRNEACLHHDSQSNEKTFQKFEFVACTAGTLA